MDSRIFYQRWTLQGTAIVGGIVYELNKNELFMPGKEGKLF